MTLGHEQPCSCGAAFLFVPKTAPKCKFLACLGFSFKRNPTPETNPKDFRGQRGGARKPGRRRADEGEGSRMWC